MLLSLGRNVAILMSFEHIATFLNDSVFLHYCAYFIFKTFRMSVVISHVVFFMWYKLYHSLWKRCTLLECFKLQSICIIHPSSTLFLPKYSVSEHEDLQFFFRINHTVILEDPFDDPPDLPVPDRSPEPTKEQLDVSPWMFSQ